MSENNAFFIIRTEHETLGVLYLYDYVGRDEEIVRQKVKHAAYRDGFKGSVDDRLKNLGWKIVRVFLTEF